MRLVALMPRARIGLLLAGLALLACQRSARAGDELQGEMYELNDLKITPINLETKLLRPCMVWADAKGSAVIIVDSNGVLRRVSFPEFKMVKQADLERKCNWMAMSADGLVLSMPDPQEVWLVDPMTFDVKKKVGVPKLKQAAAAPAHSIVVAADSEWFNTKCYVIDLKKGKAAKFNLPQDAPKSVGFHDPVMTPDGKYVFTSGGIEMLHRFSFKGSKLKFEESSRRLISGALNVGLQVSPDSKYVCHPAGGGNTGTAKPYDIVVFPVTSFKQQQCTLEGLRADACGFDPVARLIYGGRFRIYSMTGILKKEYKGLKGPGGFSETQPRQILVHPEGYKMLYLTPARLNYIEVPSKKK